MLLLLIAVVVTSHVNVANATSSYQLSSTLFALDHLHYLHEIFRKYLQKYIFIIVTTITCYPCVQALHGLEEVYLGELLVISVVQHLEGK